MCRSRAPAARPTRWVSRAPTRARNWAQRAAAGMPARTQGGYSSIWPSTRLRPVTARTTKLLRHRRPARSTDSGASFTGLAACTRYPVVGVLPSAEPDALDRLCGNDGASPSTDGGATWVALTAAASRPDCLNLSVKRTPQPASPSALYRTTGCRRRPAPPARDGTARRAGGGWTSPSTESRPAVRMGQWILAEPCTRSFARPRRGELVDQHHAWTTTDAGCYLAPSRPTRAMPGSLRQREPKPMAEPERRQQLAQLGAFPGSYRSPGQRRQRGGRRRQPSLREHKRAAATVGAPNGVTSPKSPGTSRRASSSEPRST